MINRKLRKMVTAITIVAMIFNSQILPVYASEVEECVIEQEVALEEEVCTPEEARLIEEMEEVTQEPEEFEVIETVEEVVEPTSEEVEEVIEEATDMSLAIVSGDDETVPYGNYLSWEEVFWAANNKNCLRIPEGWNVFDVKPCTSACGGHIYGIEGDGVYSVVHADTYWGTSTSHYSNWAVTLADGSTVYTKGSELLVGEPRVLTRTNTTTIKTGIRRVWGSDGLRYTMYNNTGIGYEIWTASAGGKYDDTTTWYDYTNNTSSVLTHVTPSAATGIIDIKNAGVATLTMIVESEGVEAVMNVPPTGAVMPFPTAINDKTIYGWNTDPNFRGEELDMSNLQTTTTFKDTTIYAKTKKYWHKVVDGAEVYYLGVDEGETLQLEPFGSNSPDYAFYGWYLDADCTIPYDPEAEITGDLDIYADYNVAYGNYMHRDELIWNDTFDIALPTGWHVFDYMKCTSGCGGYVVGIQGDGVYAIVHDNNINLAHNGVSANHYYQFNVTMASGAVVEVTSGEINQGDARTLELRTTNTTKLCNLIYDEYGTRIGLVTAAKNTIINWRPMEGGTYKNTDTWYENETNATVRIYVGNGLVGGYRVMNYKGSPIPMSSMVDINLKVPSEPKYEGTIKPKYASKTVAFPTNTWNGSYIKGWYYDENFRTEEIDVRNYVSSLVPGSTTTIYAKIHDYWHKVTENNGKTVYYVGQNEGEKLSLVEPTFSDFEFVGWYLDEDFTIEFHPDTDGVTTDLELYAKYVIDTFTLTIEDVDGEIIEVLEIPEYKYITQLGANEVPTENSFQLVREDMTFRLTDPEVFEDKVFGGWDVSIDPTTANAYATPIYYDKYNEIIIYDENEMEIGTVTVEHGKNITQINNNEETVITQVIDHTTTEFITTSNFDIPVGYEVVDWELEYQNGDVIISPVIEEKIYELDEDEVLAKIVDKDNKLLFTLPLKVDTVVSQNDKDDAELKSELVTLSTVIIQLEEDDNVPDGYYISDWELAFDEDYNVILKPMITEIIEVEPEVPEVTEKTFDIVDEQNNVIDRVTVKSDTKITILDEKGTKTEVLFEDIEDTLVMENLDDLADYYFDSWEVEVTDDEVIIKPVYKKYVYVNIEIYDLEKLLVDKYTVSKDTDVEVFNKDKAAMTGSKTVIVGASEETLEISLLEILQLTPYSIEVKDLVFNEFNDTDEYNVVIVLENPDVVEGHTFTGWKSEMIDGEIIVKPIYEEIVELEVTEKTFDIVDEQNNVIDRVTVKSDTKITILDEKGTKTEVLFEDLEDKLAMEDLDDLGDYYFDGWEVEVTENEVIIKPVYKEIETGNAPSDDDDDDQTGTPSDDDDDDQTGTPSDDDADQTGTPSDDDADQTGTPSDDDADQTGTPTTNSDSDNEANSQFESVKTGDATSTMMLYLTLTMSLYGIYVSLKMKRKY